LIALFSLISFQQYIFYNLIDWLHLAIGPVGIQYIQDCYQQHQIHTKKYNGGGVGNILKGLLEKNSLSFLE